MRRLIIIVTAFLAVLAVIFLIGFIFEKTYPFPAQLTFGVSFSPQFARYLGLDWQKTYLKTLDELGVKNLRLPTYWSELEPEKSRFNFSDTDFMLDQADEKGAKVILVLGFRQPRWPECHIPEWVSKLNVKDRQSETLKFITTVLERYKDRKSVWAYQVENEPLLPFFGPSCGWPDSNFLKKEVSLIRSLDKKAVMVTDSGEFGFWVIPMQLSDIFGTTIYRRSYDPILGYKTYPLLPYFYNLKSFLVRNIFAKNNTKTIISELQAEPWLSMKDSSDNIPANQMKRFSAEDFKANINFAKKTGFDTAYLWGVEWWYFMAKNGYPQYLDYARLVFDESAL